MQKPPLGLTPRKIWNARRITDIFDAMERFSKAQKPIPLEWITELRELAMQPTSIAIKCDSIEEFKKQWEKCVLAGINTLTVTSD